MKIKSAIQPDFKLGSAIPQRDFHGFANTQHMRDYVNRYYKDSKDTKVNFSIPQRDFPELGSFLASWATHFTREAICSEKPIPLVQPKLFEPNAEWYKPAPGFFGFLYEDYITRDDYIESLTASGRE